MANVLVDRWMAKTPKFFKKVITICAFFGGIGGAITVAGDTVPEHVNVIGKYMVTAGIVGAGVAKLTKEDSPEDTKTQA